MTALCGGDFQQAFPPSLGSKAVVFLSHRSCELVGFQSYCGVGQSGMGMGRVAVLKKI